MVADPRTQSGRVPKASAFWNDRDVRAVLYQVLLVLGIVLIGWWLIRNTLSNLEARRIATGFGFLERESGFGISEHVIEFSPADSYLRAIIVGLLNTLKVAAIGIVLATVWGTLLGVARVSTDWLIRKLSTWYVEVVRNTPLLLQLFLWYAFVTEGLPDTRQAMQMLTDVFLSKRGLRYPTVVDDPVHVWMWLALLIAIVLATIWRKRAKAHHEATGQIRPLVLPTIGLMIVLPAIPWLVFGAPLQLDAPVLRGFNFQG